jgi:hypothetical protein
VSCDRGGSDGAAAAACCAVGAAEAARMVSGPRMGGGGHFAPVEENATNALMSCKGLNVLTSSRSFQWLSAAFWYNMSCMLA